MTATYGSAKPSALATRRRRQNAVVLICATVIGLWFGVSAPNVSPVTPASATTVPASDAPAIPGGIGPFGRDGGRR